MIDIHSHILPMVDDGASSVKMALDMLDDAYQDGTDEIILTPHLAYPYGFINPKEKIQDLFDDLKRIIKYEGIPIKIYLGCEYLFTDEKSFELQFDEITTLNHTKYLLMEFYFDVSEEEMLNAIDCVLNKDLIPIIAHPERFDCIQDNEKFIHKIIEKGALLQMNKGSILARYGSSVKHTCEYILDHHYYSFVGSDAHNINKRTSLIYDAYDEVRNRYGHHYANKIFKDNPKKMLEDIDIRKENNHD